MCTDTDTPQYPEPLSNFAEGQWWVEELDALTKNATEDQRRAMAVVHHMLKSIALNRAIDVTAPEIVEVLTDVSKGVLHVNVDGACVFRACQIKALTLGTTPIFRDRSYA